ncbi:hypothetical protein OPV22_010448 [Ensete ventricosum]|uniref:DUF834 domain-containing protein n=1 Tax=Ensete ventricosum TaxID=4639 RepID=A0AAV8RHF8_ENSVE|nr:hypothetical protein OPV22_010448 [Ensete ventricosum]
MEKGRRQRRLRLRRAWLCGLQVEDGGGDSRGDVTKRLREVAGALEMKRRGGTAAGATRLCSGDRHRSVAVPGRGRRGQRALEGNAGSIVQEAMLAAVEGGKRRWQWDRCVSRRNYGSESKMGRNIISVGGAGEGRGSGGKRVEQQDGLLGTVEQQDRKWAAALAATVGTNGVGIAACGGGEERQC